VHRHASATTWKFLRQPISIWRTAIKTRLKMCMNSFTQPLAKQLKNAGLKGVSLNFLGFLIGINANMRTQKNLT
jgi:hypothetical protein